jgi:hypothetical protein
VKAYLVACLLSMTAYRAAADLVITYKSVVVGRGTTKDLGGWPVNSMNQYTFSATNTGTGALTLPVDHSISWSGKGFKVESFNDLPASIGAGVTATFILSFESAGMAAGSTASGSLSISYSGAPGSPFEFTVTISVTATSVPEINVRLQGGGDIPSGTADAISFGNQPVNTSSAPRTVIIDNIGSADLAVGGVTSSTGGFKVSTPAGSIPAGGSSAFTIRFTPAAVQAFNNVAVTINNNDSDEGAYIFTISGNGLAPEMASVESIFISRSERPDASSDTCTGSVVNYVHFNSPKNITAVMVDPSSSGIALPRAGQWSQLRPLDCLTINVTDTEGLKTIKLRLKDSRNRVTEVSGATTAFVSYDRGGRPKLTAVKHGFMEFPGFGRLLCVALTFSEEVVATSKPKLTLVSGDVAYLSGSYLLGSGTKELVFSHMVQPGDALPPSFADGSRVRVVLSEGTIRDFCGNDADWQIGAPLYIK